MSEASNSGSDALGQQELMSSGASKLRWVGLVFAGVGMGAILTYLFSRTTGSSNSQRARRTKIKGHIVDDRGTGQSEASEILRNLRDRAFDASNEKLAVALGRPAEEIDAWNTGREPIDDDVIMKARGIAIHRGVEID